MPGLLILNDILCPLLIDGLIVPDANDTQSPPLILYCEALLDSLTVNPSSNASIVKYSW